MTFFEVYLNRKIIALTGVVTEKIRLGGGIEWGKFALKSVLKNTYKSKCDGNSPNFHNL